LSGYVRCLDGEVSMQMEAGEAGRQRHVSRVMEVAGTLDGLGKRAGCSERKI
jgi:hypothetical protein